MPLRMAWSIPSGEVPTISVTRYVRSVMVLLRSVAGPSIVGVLTVPGRALGCTRAAAHGEVMAREAPAAFCIPIATRSHSADVGARQRRYLISMTIRTA